MDKAFKLLAHERDSALWVRLREHYQDRLNTLRKLNDSDSLTEPETARLRGRIKEIKYFLWLEPEDK